MSIVLRTNCECLEHPFVAPQNLSLDNIVDCEHLKFVMFKHPQFEHLWFVFNYVFNVDLEQFEIKQFLQDVKGMEIGNRKKSWLSSTTNI
jgi:hypothetical protein